MMMMRRQQQEQDLRRCCSSYNYYYSNQYNSSNTSSCSSSSSSSSNNSKKRSTKHTTTTTSSSSSKFYWKQRHQQHGIIASSIRCMFLMLLLFVINTTNNDITTTTSSSSFFVYASSSPSTASSSITPSTNKVTRSNSSTSSSSNTNLPFQLQKVFRTARRFFNIGSTFGTSRTAITPYEKIMGHPVFSVTTPYGSPYMNMEKLTDLNEVIPTTTSGSSNKKPQSLSEEQNEYRMVALYFCDPDDAISTHGEMKQLDNMNTADIRLTSFSLGKAIRHASNIGIGLVTGAPPDVHDGNYKPPDDGSMIRYKIVPSKRQLYYAARCYGKERVGLFSENPVDDAQAAVLGNAAIESTNLLRRRMKMERKTRQNISKLTTVQQQNQHMDGYSGIPIFYCSELIKQYPYIKSLITGTKYEIPMFFNYEDLMNAWNVVVMKKRKEQRQQQKKDNSRDIIKTPPSQPSTIEVFNLWDVLTSIDKYQNSIAGTKNSIKKMKQLSSVKSIKERFRRNPVLTNPNKQLTLNDISFIPDSRSVHYKDSITTRGNGKARLRPMRNYQ